MKQIKLQLSFLITSMAIITMTFSKYIRIYVLYIDIYN